MPQPHLTYKTPFLFVAIYGVINAILCGIGEASEQGQTPANELRHAVAVSSLPSHFGKKGHAVLSRSVVPESHVWRDVDDFTRELFSDPARLDWFVADVSSDCSSGSHSDEIVTISGAFSCLDQGRSRSKPLTWWAANNFTELKSLKDDIGGAVEDTSGEGDATATDITYQCLRSRTYDPSLRIVEHHGQHDGTGVSFMKSRKSPPELKSIIGNAHIFDDISRFRREEDRANDVVYLNGIPIVVGLTFDSGVHIKVPSDFTTEKTLELRVPMTFVAAITAHTGARLETLRSANSSPKTSDSELFLTQLSTGLTLLAAVWIVTKYLADTVVGRSQELRNLPTDAAVHCEEGWSKPEKWGLVIHIVAVSILAAPTALAIVRHELDPRVFVEVTTGVTVFYGSTQPELSLDDRNFVAGAPFIVTGWISTQKLNASFSGLLLSTLAGMLFFCCAIALLEWKKMDQVMPKRRETWSGFSFWMGLGWLRLWWKSRKEGAKKEYRVYVKIREECFSNHERLNALRELLFLSTNVGRLRALQVPQNATRPKDVSNQRAAGAMMYSAVMKGENRRFGLLANIQMCNFRRFETMMIGRRYFAAKSCPRQWEYLRRSIAGCESLEYYRVNGLYPPDKALIVLQLGLLEYVEFVDEIQFVKKTTENIYLSLVDEHDRNDGGVKCIIAVSDSQSDTSICGENGNNDGIIFKKFHGHLPRTLQLPLMGTTVQEIPEARQFGGAFSLSCDDVRNA